MFADVNNLVKSDTFKSVIDSATVRAVMQSVMKKQSGKTPGQSAANDTSETNEAVSGTSTNKVDDLEEWVEVSAERVSFEKDPRKKAGDAHLDEPAVVCSLSPSCSK